MKKIWSPLLATALTLSACAANKPVPTPPAPTVSVSSSQGQGTGSTEQVVTVTAAVQSIDAKKRMVTLKGPDGNLVTVKVRDEVQNLDQVKKGDLVTAAFYESIAYEVKKKGTVEPGVAEAADAARAPAGEKPAGLGAAAVTVVATISGIDKKTNTVTLKGPEGNTVNVKVKDPSRLEGVKVGDLVEITYTEAVAISVDKAPKS